MRADLIVSRAALPAMGADAIAMVRRLEAEQRSDAPPTLKTHHVLHGGVYSRTVHLQPGAIITGALVKVPTTLTINGHVTAYIGGDTLELCGYNVIAASAGRKQAFAVHAPTDMTMAFATAATTVAEAEDEFTDEAHLLLSRQQTEVDEAVITGE
jgi:hypothetical protein